MTKAYRQGARIAVADETRVEFNEFKRVGEAGNEAMLRLLAIARDAVQTGRRADPRLVVPVNEEGY